MEVNLRFRMSNLATRRHSLRNLAVVGFSTVALLTFAISAQAGINLVTNGSFESNSGNGQVGYNTSITGWSVPSGGYTFLFAPGTADTSGANGQYGYLSLWGPGNGSNNGLPATSPDGGYYLASDGAFQVQPIQQTINGLTIGHNYMLGFLWGGAQQIGFTGATTEQWQVSLGNSTQLTSVLNNASQGFTGWEHVNKTFTATNTSEVLSFLAIGTPA